MWNTRTASDMAAQDAALRADQRACEEAVEARRTYKRRADLDDLTLPIKLGILMTELEMAETAEEVANAQAAVDRMKETIAKLSPKPSTGDWWVQR